MRIAHRLPTQLQYEENRLHSGLQENCNKMEIIRESGQNKNERRVCVCVRVDVYFVAKSDRKYNNLNKNMQHESQPGA